MTTSRAPNPGQQHYVFLDGLRGVAAIMVLLLHWFEGHGKPLFGSGLLAVDFFFILSGFVVSYAYQQRLIVDRRSARFVRQRLIRLYPMIAAGTLLGFLRFDLLSYQQTGRIFDGDLASQLVKGLALLPDNVQAGVSGFFPLNNALWSLHFEFIAYIAFWLLLYRVGTVSLGIIVIVAAVGCYLWAAMTFGAGGALDGRNEHITGYFHALSRVAFSFTLGVILYRMKDRLARIALPGGRWLVLLLIAALIMPRPVVPAFVVMILLMVVFPYIVLAGTRVDEQPRLSRVDKFLGDLSYPLYALHVPLIWTMSGVCKTLGLGFTETPLLNGLFILPLTLLFSYAAFTLYDRPVRRWLTARLTRRKSEETVSVGAAAF